MKLKCIRWTSGLTLTALLTFAGCDETADNADDGVDIPEDASGGDSDVYVGSSSLECNEASEEESTLALEAEDLGISVAVDGNTITVNDPDARLNCCLDAWMEATLAGNTITVVETEDLGGESCFCTCGRDLSVEIPDLEAGTYDIAVYRLEAVEENLLHETTATVGTAQSALSASYEVGACVEAGEGLLKADDGVTIDLDPETDPASSTDEDTSSDIYLRIDGGTVVVVHEASPLNCCAEVEVEVTMEGNTVTVTEYEISAEEGLCLCTCNRTIETTLEGLGEGDYDINHSSVSAAGVSSFITLLSVHCGETVSGDFLCSK